MLSACRKHRQFELRLHFAPRNIVMAMVISHVSPLLPSLPFQGHNLDIKVIPFFPLFPGSSSFRPFDVRIFYGGIKSRQLMITPSNVPPRMKQLTMCMWLKVQEKWKADYSTMLLVKYSTQSFHQFGVAAHGYRSVQFYAYISASKRSKW